MKKIERSTLLLFLLFWFLSALFLLVISNGISPANPYYMADSSAASSSPHLWAPLLGEKAALKDLEAVENAAIREVLSERYERVSHAGQNPEWDWDQVSLYHRIK